MKQMKRNLIILIATCLLLPYSLVGQVTIGSSDAPMQGTLLDLKQYDDQTAHDGGRTADRGLVMPRVELKDPHKLVMGNMQINDGDDGGNQNLQHIGLWVYNITDDATFCPGIYVWDGSQWNKLGEPCVKLSVRLRIANPLFYNGQYGMSTYHKPGMLDWEPKPSTASWSNEAVDGYAKVTMDSPEAITPHAPWTSSPLLSINPDPMTKEELAANPFLVKKSKIKITVTDGKNSASTEETITQENKIAFVNGSLNPNIIMVTSSKTGQPATVQANATWQITNSPATNSAITNISKTRGGQDMEVTGTRPPVENITFDIRVGGSYPRYSFLTFSDTESNRRYKDVMLTVAQCTGSSDLSMLQYKELWEKIYGTKEDVDEPDSNGDIGKNVNQVQWHKDQDGNIFFSAMFGGKRWMTTNLTAKTYASESPIKPALTQSWASSIDNGTYAAYYGYPGGSSAGDATQYNNRPRIGRVYNWYAATGNQNKETSVDQKFKEQTPIQGICPNGWYLPSHLEWSQLADELEKNPTKYSTNTNATNSMITARDQCEFTTGDAGMSHNILDGGFTAMLAGMGAGTSAGNFREVGFYWTASFNKSGGYTTYAYMFLLHEYAGKMSRDSSSVKGPLFSVRCIKN